MIMSLTVLVLSVIFILLFYSGFVQGISFHLDVWKKVSYKFLRLIGVIMASLFTVAMIILLLIRQFKSPDNSFHIIIGVLLFIQLYACFCYMQVLNFIGTCKNNEIIDKRLTQIFKKQPDLTDVHEIMKACIITYDKVYTYKDIRKSLIRLEKRGNTNITKVKEF